MVGSGGFGQTRRKPSWAKRWCSLVQAKLLLETKKQQDVSIEIRGPLASTKEHQYDSQDVGRH